MENLVCVVLVIGRGPGSVGAASDIFHYEEADEIDFSSIDIEGV